MLGNQLVEHPSPYLAMHAEDPVHWQTWSRATLQKARELNRPLLISIGYFSCHWCHVMQRESYQDAALAKLLNAHFVPVKVDRELHPALDAHLIEFVQLTRGQAGWPLNVLLTPDGYPVLGLVYMPRDRFYQLLDTLQQRWRDEPGQLRRLAREGMAEWRRVREAEAGEAAVPGSVINGMLLQSGQIWDDMAGGFGQQTKFPMVSQLGALLWIRQQRDDPELEGFIRLTLDRMAGQGLHDLLGGGFFRYTTDPAWQVPHFEKMLYDNARLALLYLQAAELLDAPAYREIGLETLDFMLREMRGEAGYFISSFSAVDAEGREGFYYLWDDAQLERLLSADELRAVRAAWFGGPADTLDYGKLPRWQARAADIARKLGWGESRLDQTLASARRKLLAARAERSLPADDKGLAAWNGLALSALAAGFTASGDARYQRAAGHLARWLSTRLWDGERLVRARDGGAVLAEATLEDYALVAQGLWDWSRLAPAEEKQRYTALVAQLVRSAWQRYFRNERWLQSDTPLIPMLEGRLALDDSALPSATATLARLGRQHADLRKDAALQRQVEAHLDQVRAYLGDALFWYASYVALLGKDQPER